ncbi:unnamed protein product [Notodromas monacha]|uniref:Integrin beta n=1 Tax=Notodromas monacha TaxID=399045 RepID=A0A7R9GFZ5_9CRUS|nr:unnamed protein product [Notodromas monacha]CAG0919657.1 unnamed protein product [Notodromas monacha]
MGAFGLLALGVLALATVAISQKTSLEDQGSNPCSGKQTCSECIQTATCAWCSQLVRLASSRRIFGLLYDYVFHDFLQNYTSPDGVPIPRCHQQNRYRNDKTSLMCDPQFLKNPVNEVNHIRNVELTKGVQVPSSSGSGAFQYINAVQIKPQRVSLKCRINEAQDLEVFYAQAEDYPVDLYYLMDLSKSMEDDKATLSKLGVKLAEEMRKLTSNFRLGFGSFVDKVVMPYVSTVPKNLESPCRGCEAPYGFKNALPLTTEATWFSKEVHDARVSGNLDAPEGGFDAIMQAVVCTDEIGWRPNARRLLVFSTDASFHYAGDGKLGGIIMPNDGMCHLDSSGNYTHSTILDYPSVSQVSQKVKEHQVNLIFAVTEEQRSIYNALASSIQGASAGTLSSDSANVVDLIKEEYRKITSAVELRDNATGPVQITYYSKCLDANGPERQTSKCEGLRIGSKVQFTINIKVTKCPKDPSQRKQTIKIEPVGVNESLIVDLEMQCECDCEKPGNPGFKPAISARECNYNGDLKCGICACKEQYRGRACECNATHADTDDMQAGCRPDNRTEILCSGRGDCVCGECQCFPRSNPEETIYGQFCECDNFSCDRNRGLLCSGPTQGECACGKCNCLGLWTGRDCSCLNSTDECRRPGDKELCSGRGKCECNKCLCHETESGNRYSGKYCQRCNTCPGLCAELRNCVQCQVFKNGAFKDDEEACNNCTFRAVEVDVLEPNNTSEDERLCILMDEDGCQFRFAYGTNGANNLQVRVQRTRTCPPIINIMGIVAGVVAAIVAMGLVFILLWKVLTTIHDRREFAKFEEERLKASWEAGENPLYKQATTTFKNPMYGGKM